jgi:cyclopropane-fatty-acyl-phospholipid synthase
MDNRDENLLSVALPKREASGAGQPAKSGHARSRGPGRRLVGYLLEFCGNPPIEIVLWNGEKVSPAGTVAPLARVHIHDRAAFWRLMADPELYFGDAYASGQIEVEGDLVEFLVAVYRGLDRVGSRGFLRAVGSWLHRPRSTSVRRARDNIYSHYDIGNDFYRLWLDQELVYTCAYFPRADATIEEAQQAKMHHVCRKLRLREGESVVEAGCGWGSLALFMARNYGVRVKAYNISRQQIAYARERAQREGLADRVEFVEDDYRNIAGQYDAFVSVGMLEHVGTRFYPALGAVIDRSLKEEGRGLVHSIGRIRPAPMNAWIERRIFPGAYPPSLAEMMPIFEPFGFSILDVENLRLHYARTLEHWLARYEQAVGRVRDMFDERFVRTWRLYLAGSIAAFLTGELQLFQVVFNRAQSNEVPWTRAHLYLDDAPEGSYTRASAPRPGTRRDLSRAL